MFFQEDQRFLKDFSGQRKNYRISRTKQKKCQGFAASVQKKWNVKQFEETKKQTHRGERKKKSILSDFHTVQQGWCAKTHLCHWARAICKCFFLNLQHFVKKWQKS